MLIRLEERSNVNGLRAPYVSVNSPIEGKLQTSSIQPPAKALEIEGTIGRRQNCTYATVALVVELAIGAGLSRVDTKHTIRASLSFKLAPDWINDSNESCTLYIDFNLPYVIILIFPLMTDQVWDALI